MNPLVRFWKEQYGVDAPLEADSWAGRLLNRYVVAALMNTFPKTATRVFSTSRGELARLLFGEREGGSYRVLRAMYRFDDRHDRGDLINRLLMQSPAVKAARNRRRIAQRMLDASLDALPSDSPTLVLAVGGGDGSLEAEVIARNHNPQVYYCGIDSDPRAAAENLQVLKEHGLERRGLTIVGRPADARDLEAALASACRQLHVRFEGISISVCQGIAEYFDLDSQTNDALASLLEALHRVSLPRGRLIISQTGRHDRVTYLERGLSWRMRLRSGAELAAEIVKAGWRLAICAPEPMGLITMCLAEKPPGSLPLRDPERLSQEASSAFGRGLG